MEKISGKGVETFIMADNVIFKTGNIEQKEPAKVKGQVLFSVNNAGKGEIYFDKDENTRIRMSGNTAEKLEDAVTIGLSGDISGSASFDGSQDITISATLKDKFAGSSSQGGAANAALKLINASGDYNAGDSNTPVYFENGVPKPVTSIDVTSDKAKLLDPGALINGTLFTGAQDITTKVWGEARTINISDNSGAHTQANAGINGETNFTLKLPSIITATLIGKADTAGHADTAGTADSAKQCTGNANTATTWANNVVFGISNKADGSKATINGDEGTATLGIPSTISGFTSISSTKFVGALEGKATSAGTADSATNAGHAVTADSAAAAEVAVAANKLTSGNSINGTTFDGTMPITTKSWGPTVSFTTTDGTNTSTAVTSTGESAVNIKLPSTIKANITGNVTGNVSGSSGSCTGNAATATKWKTGVKLGIAATAGSSTIIIDGDEGTTNTTSLQIPATITGFTSISSDKFVGALDGNAKTATSATNANHATTADSATEAENAEHANTATSASTAGLANKATALENPQQMQVALGSTTAATFDGTGSATIGVSGTLGVPNGGTGATSFTSGQVLIGNGTAAVSTKPITSSVTADSTSLVTSGAVAAYAPSKTGAGASGDWNINITGSASKLTTKRTINGTEFDGSGNITTANWGTARNITIGNTQKSVNGSQAYTWTLNEVGALPGKTTSATTAATAGWYRIATSAVSETNNLGQFIIQAAPSGKHCLAIINAGISYGKGVNLQQMSFVNYTNSPVLTKARIVYHTTYSNNYAYLEVYVSSATATPITVQFTGFGWSLVTPSTAGSIPSGYTSKEITFVADSIVSNLSGKATTAGTADKAKALNTAQSLLTHLDSTGAASFDGSGSASIGVTGTLGVSNGGTGNTTFTAGEVLVGNGTEAIETKAIDTSVTSNSSNLITSGAVAAYAPSKTGSGASGNWGINVTGSAGSLSAKPTINGTAFDGATGITTSTWGPTVSFTTTDGTNTSTAVTGNGSSAISIKLPSTIKANLSGKATSAGTADSATTATTATTCTGNAATATALAKAVTINGASFDGTQGITTTTWGPTVSFTTTDGTNSSTAVTSTGNAAVNIKLPSTIKANIVGNITGNVSGSSGSCTGNAATASKLQSGFKLGISNTAGSSTSTIYGNEGTTNTISLQIPATMTGFTSITSTAFVGRASSAGILTDANGTGINAGNKTTPIYFEGGIPKAIEGDDYTLDVKVENAITAERWSKSLTFNIASMASGLGTAVYGPTDSNGNDVTSVSLNLPTTITNLTKIVATTFEGYLDGTAKKATNADNATNATNATNAAVAAKLGTADKGSATVPIYLDDGVPKECTSISLTAARATADADGNTFSTSYLKLAGGNMSDGATIRLSQYGNRFVNLTGNGFSFDLSSATGGWAGTFAGLKDPTGTTTTMLGYYGGTEGLTHVFMGGVYNDPAMKMDKDGNFTFKNTIVGNISGRAETAGSAATADTAGKWTNKLKLGVSGAATGEIEFDGSEGTKSLELTLSDVPWSKITGEPGNASTSANGFMSSTDKAKLDNTNVAYGTCTTAAATAEKVVTIDGNSNWALTKGALITVKFSNTNTATKPSLNVNNTGAKFIYYNNAVYTSNSSYGGYQNRHITYQYDGTYWVFISWSYDSNSDTKVTQEAAITTAGSYPILLGYNTSTTAVTNTVKKTSTLLYNPNTQTLSIPHISGTDATFTTSVTAPSFVGDLTGTASNASVADSLSQTLGISGGGTGNTEFIANKIVFSKTNAQLAGASGHYISDTQISLGDTSAPSSGMEVRINGDVEKTAGHIYLTGAKPASSTSNTTQIVFGTASDNHVAISSNNNALVINPSTTETTPQIVLYLDKSSLFPNGITVPATSKITGDLTGTADKAKKLDHNVTVTFSEGSHVSGSFVLSSLSQESYTTNNITVKDNSHKHTFSNITDGATVLGDYAKKDGSNVSGTWSNLSIGGNAATASKWASKMTLKLSGTASTSDNPTSVSFDGWEGANGVTLSMPKEITGFAKVSSAQVVLNEGTTNRMYFQYNATNESCEFVFV